jgi:peptide/nickel transport system permease protein
MAWGIDPEQIDLLHRFSSPSWDHPLGTDELGRDVLIRLLLGGRISLTVGLTAALAAAGLGTAIGLVAGYCGGRLDTFLMRLTDAVIALPLLPLLIVLASLEPALAPLTALLPEDAWIQEIAPIVLVISLVGWTTAARLVRAETLAARQQVYIRATEALGAGPIRIMWVHLLPNVTASLVVATTLSVGGVILTESVLSFLGLGINPPTPSWGNMLSNAQDLIHTAPALAIYPGLAIFLVVAACNLLGEGLRRAWGKRE